MKIAGMEKALIIIKELRSLRAPTLIILWNNSFQIRCIAPASYVAKDTENI